MPHRISRTDYDVGDETYGRRSERGSTLRNQAKRNLAVHGDMALKTNRRTRLRALSAASDKRRAEAKADTKVSETKMSTPRSDGKNVFANAISMFDEDAQAPRTTTLTKMTTRRSKMSDYTSDEEKKRRRSEDSGGSLPQRPTRQRSALSAFISDGTEALKEEGEMVRAHARMTARQRHSAPHYKRPRFQVGPREKHEGFKPDREEGNCPKGGPHVFRFGRCRKCGIGEGEHVQQMSAVVGVSRRRRTEVKEVRKTCPTCGYRWLDKYGKNECPKCLAPLNKYANPHGRRIHTDVAIEAVSPTTRIQRHSGFAKDTETGTCRKGGAHVFRFGRCRKCGLGEGAHLAEIHSPKNLVRGTYMEKRKMCPTCAYSWLDKYNKNECPKCLQRLDPKKLTAGRRVIHTDVCLPVNDKFVTSVTKGKGYSEDRQEGRCPEGGRHVFRFGVCRKCHIGEGAFAHEKFNAAL